MELTYRQKDWITEALRVYINTAIDAKMDGYTEDEIDYLDNLKTEIGYAAESNKRVTITIEE